jgi:hypothetical protein
MSTKELCRRVRTTPRAVQWWCETGIVKCQCIGHTRSFDETQALVAAIVAELRYRGVSMWKCRKLRIRNPKGEFLVVSGITRHWCTKEGLLRCVAKAPGSCVVVSLEDLRRRLQ